MKKGKKTMTKRALAWILSLVMVVSFIPFASFAAEDEVADNAEVEYESMTIGGYTWTPQNIWGLMGVNKPLTYWQTVAPAVDKFAVMPKLTLPMLTMLMSAYPKVDWTKAFKAAGFNMAKYAYDKAKDEWREIEFKTAAAIFAAVAAQGVMVDLYQIFKEWTWQKINWKVVKWAVLAKTAKDWSALFDSFQDFIKAKIEACIKGKIDEAHKKAALAAAAGLTLAFIAPKMKAQITDITVDPVKECEKAQVTKFIENTFGYDLTTDDYFVTLDKDGNVKVLYKVTVTGTPGATFIIDDQGSKLVNPELNVIQHKGQIKGYLPFAITKDGKVKETFFVSKVFKAPALDPTEAAPFGTHFDLTLEVTSKTADVAPNCKDTGIVYVDKVAELIYVIDGKDAKKVDVLSGVKTKPDYAPELKEGYTFMGWYDNPEYTGDPVTEVEVIGTKKLYGKYEVTPVPPALNSEDHFAYIIGYPDGTVKPMNTITRAEAATIFFRLLKDEVRDINIRVSNDFSDVNVGQWYNTAISTLAGMGIASGYADGTFNPNAPITRAEFITMCVRFDTSGFTGESNFADIADSWAKENIDKAYIIGWASGYSSTEFGPNQLISRAEVATIINRVLHRIPADADALLPAMNRWSDNQPSNWYYLALQEATNSHEAIVDEETLLEEWVDMMADRDWTVYER